MDKPIQAELPSHKRKIWGVFSKTIEGFMGGRWWGRRTPILWIVLLCLSSIGFPLISHALTVQEVPNPQQEYNGWVTDMADILSDRTEAELNQMISELEAKNGREIAVVTVPTTAPAATPKAFATELFNYWGIGKEDTENGVLFLTSLGDRRVEIETGYGVEGLLPDARVGNIIQEKIAPQFREENWDRGVLAGTEALVSVLSNDAIEPEFPNNPSNRGAIAASGILAFGLSLFGYQKLKYIAREPIQLPPQGRSRVLGKFDDTFYPGLSVWLYVALTALCFTFFLVPLLFAELKILWLWFSAIAAGIVVLFAIYKLLRGYWSWAGTKYQELGNFMGVFYLIFASLILLVVVTTFLLIIGGAIVFTAFALFYAFGENFVFEILASLAIALVLAYPITQWILAGFRSRQTIQCAVSKTPMTRIDPELHERRLTHPQTVAKQLGSTRFEGWHCSTCYPNNLSMFHLRGYVIDLHRFSECPTCQEFTVTQTHQILSHPTYSSTGESLTTYTCQACNYRNETRKIIPVLTYTSTSSSSSYGGSFGGGGSSGGSSGGGSFGGGSSGGGGAGGDF